MPGNLVKVSSQDETVEKLLSAGASHAQNKLWIIIPLRRSATTTGATGSVEGIVMGEDVVTPSSSKGEFSIAVKDSI